MLVDIYEDGELTAMNVPLARALSAHFGEQTAAILAIRSTGAAFVRSEAPAFRVLKRVPNAEAA